LNAESFVQHLKNFMKARRAPAFVVLDGHPAHIAKVVARYVQSLKGKLELHFLPGYAPELNPDEFVWNHVKQHKVSKRPLRRGESLHIRIQDDLRSIGRNRRLVRPFFGAPSVAYVTD
jgi:transposase